MIELRQVNKSYSTRSGDLIALSDINLTVKPGEIFGVIGKSGAGKSTLIRTVNLLERPTSGSVLVDGKDLIQLSPKALRESRRQISMIFQHFNLLAHRTVLDNVGLPLELIGKNSSDIRTEVLPLLDLVGLSNKKAAYPSQLSGGQKQRVAIARALATRPKVLLCDEMTSALDPETTRAILELIQSINEQLRLSILLITHEMSVIKSIADQVAVLDHGRIIEQSDVFSLFTDPKTAVTRSFIRATLPLELPVALMNKVKKAPFFECAAIWRLAFSGPLATEPVISGMVRELEVHINILQANLELIRHQQLGMMIIAIEGSPEKMAESESYLTKRGLRVEVVGYVNRNDWIVP
ncbi:MAG: methionine ABC transporter ATP-binding protein [Proteobacteria bacterium]|nr:methionine ABC transporter ATP-binding protein [Pseudomonadota bacterium]